MITAAGNSPGRVAEGLIERSEGAYGLVIGNDRSIAAPNYVTDLGVRRITEAETFLRFSLAELGLEYSVLVSASNHPNSIGQSLEYARDEPGNFARLADATVSFLGSWDIAAQYAMALSNSTHSVDYLDTLYAGAVLAMVGSPLAGGLLALSVDRAPSGTSQFLCSIRYAAWAQKRAKNPALCASLLRDAEQRLDIAHGPSDGDRLALKAVANNLRALSAVTTGDFDGALELSETAYKMALHGGLSLLDLDRYNRYRSQISVNRVYMLWRVGHSRDALQASIEQVAFASENHPFSLSEATSVSGYIHYLSGEYGSAINYLRTAESLISREAAPERLLNTRKTLVGALAKAGEDSAASVVFERITSDPLGFTTVTPNV